MTALPPSEEPVFHQAKYPSRTIDLPPGPPVKTLRDEFAMAALQADLTASPPMALSDHICLDRAKAAYMYANAMMKARDQ